MVTAFGHYSQNMADLLRFWRETLTVDVYNPPSEAVYFLSVTLL